MLSAFLPPDFDPARPVALIAGQGIYPILIAQAIRRAGEFKSDEALFVKTVKARQDYRFDVPCFGLKTLETMREAGLTAAALETHRVILLDKPAVLAQAKSWGIHLLGFE